MNIYFVFLRADWHAFEYDAAIKDYLLPGPLVSGRTFCGKSFSRPLTRGARGFVVTAERPGPVVGVCPACVEGVSRSLRQG
jgi:hypothetical protein